MKEWSCSAAEAPTELPEVKSLLKICIVPIQINDVPTETKMCDVGARLHVHMFKQVSQ